jgi:hypothetical protein
MPIYLPDEAKRAERRIILFDAPEEPTTTTKSPMLFLKAQNCAFGNRKNSKLSKGIAFRVKTVSISFLWSFYCASLRDQL